MNKKYYSRMNKKNYIAFILCLIGLVLVILKLNFISLALLVIIAILFDGVVSKDLFIYDDEKLYLLKYNKNSPLIFGLISFIIIASGFTLCILKYYEYSLYVFYLLLIVIYVYNIVLSYKNNFNDIGLEKEIKNYNTYLIEEIDIKDDFYNFKLKDKFSKEISFMNYKINKLVIDYKDLKSKLSSY